MTPRPSWTWTQDRQWASSRLMKNWNSTDQLAWVLETRSDEWGRGNTERLGDLHLTGSMNGTLTCRLRLEGDWSGP